MLGRVSRESARTAAAAQNTETQRIVRVRFMRGSFLADFGDIDRADLQVGKQVIRSDFTCSRVLAVGP